MTTIEPGVRAFISPNVLTSRENKPDISNSPAAKVQRIEAAGKVERVSEVAALPERGTDVPLKVKRLSENAVLPKRGSAHAAGYDLSR